MKTAVKNIIEQYIKLIEANMFNELFTRVQEEYIPTTVKDLATVLRSADIDPLPYLTFIPEGYYMLSQITDFTTPDHVRRICYNAFNNSDLERIHVTGNCFEIQSSAFEGCDMLKSATFDEGVEVIEDYAFYHCEELVSVHLPTTLKSLGHNVFNDCDNLTQINYAGTISQWYYIHNNQYINEGCYISKIVCSDGEIDLKLGG